MLWSYGCSVALHAGMIVWMAMTPMDIQRVGRPPAAAAASTSGAVKPIEMTLVVEVSDLSNLRAQIQPGTEANNQREPGEDGFDEPVESLPEDIALAQPQPPKDASTAQDTLPPTEPVPTQDTQTAEQTEPSDTQADAPAADTRIAGNDPAPPTADTQTDVPPLPPTDLLAKADTPPPTDTLIKPTQLTPPPIPPRDITPPTVPTADANPNRAIPPLSPNASPAQSADADNPPTPDVATTAPDTETATATDQVAEDQATDPPAQQADANPTEPTDSDSLAQTPTDQPDTTEVYDELGVDTHLAFEKRHRPRLPSVSQRLKETGTVTILVEVDRFGQLVDYTILEKPKYPRLVQAAIDALKKSTFTPGMKDDQPVRSTRRIVYAFK